MKPHRNIIFGLGLVATVMFAGCAKPHVVAQDGSRYIIEERQPELFVYVTYHWRGGKFSDAIDLEDAFVKWAKEQDNLVYAMGRYPTNKLWQLGFVAKHAPDAKEFQGHEIATLTLPAGKWASLRTVSHVDRLFFLWNDFADWLEEDGHKVTKPVFEVYPDILKVGGDPDTTRGEIRYFLPQ